VRIRISSGHYDDDAGWQSAEVETAADFARAVRRVWSRLDADGRLSHPVTSGRHVEIHLWRRDHWARVTGPNGGQALVSSPLHSSSLWPLVVALADHADAIADVAGRAASLTREEI
jgi:hypothetical protein